MANPSQARSHVTARPHVAVVDTGSGNLRSVQKALETVGADVVITNDPDMVARADKLVVPGQGAFGGCVAGLAREGGGLRQAVLDAITRGVPFFGICLGLQILFEGSDESADCVGLGVFPGRVVKFKVAPPLKIPHMGWNVCTRGPAGGVDVGPRATPILAGVADRTSFYFVHSYYPEPRNQAHIALHTDHGVTFCAAVARDNVFACQFHPEKSQRAGLQLLKNFVQC